MTQLPAEGRGSEAEHSVEPGELRVLFGTRAGAICRADESALPTAPPSTFLDWSLSR